MKQVRVGDRVKAFLDARIIGEVIEIFHVKAPNSALMVGGVPPVTSYTKIRLDDGRIATVKTTELSVHNL